MADGVGHPAGMRRLFPGTGAIPAGCAPITVLVPSVILGILAGMLPPAHGERRSEAWDEGHVSLAPQRTSLN